MSANQKNKIINWNSKGGFGFVTVDGKRVFVHTTVIRPRQDRGTDLNGVEIIVQKTEKTYKGFSVVSALTVVEFEKQEKEQKRADEELVADRKKLAELLSGLQEKIQDKLPLYGSTYLDGAIIRELKGEANVLSFNEKDGAVIDFTQTLLVCVGKATETMTLAWRSEGWKNISLNSNSWVYQPKEETKTMEVEMGIRFKGFVKAEFPAIASAPYIEKNAVIQDFTSVTPVGVATKKISLYSNPPDGMEHPEALWGDNIASLIAEVDMKVLTEAGILSDKIPEVKLKVEDFRVDHNTTYEYESNDSRGTRIGGSRWTTYHGGVRIDIAHSYLVKEGYVGIGFQIEMDYGLDRLEIEKYIREKIQHAEKRGLKGYDIQEYEEKLFSQIILQIPSFSREEDLWIVDEKKLAFYQLGDIPHGQAVISVDLESSTRDRTVSKAVIVAKKATADKLKLPGTPLAEAVVWWKNSPCEVIPLVQQAEQLLARLRETVASKTFSCFPVEIREKIESQLRSNTNFQPFDEANPEYVRDWCYYTKCAIDALENAEPQALVLAEKEKGGEIVTGFTAWHRINGATNQGDGWVIRLDGSLRERDSDDVPRQKSDGTYRWEVVHLEELAISWSKANTAAGHEFVVHKLPVDGCTPEQLATVECLEQAIEKRLKGTTGMSGKVSPSIGKGWNLGGKNKEVRIEEKKEEKDGLASEFAEFNKTFGR
ncbi:MAG: hypothetical protein WC788_05290 [Candidatus Paceibacterota bacterium]|jgi:cold shock CspA family protein